MPNESTAQPAGDNEAAAYGCRRPFGRPQGRQGLVKYTIVIEKAPDNYAAYAPDFPGCVATVRTRPRVIQLMREGIAFHLEGPRSDGQSVPPP